MRKDEVGQRGSWRPSAVSPAGEEAFLSPKGTLSCWMVEPSVLRQPPRLQSEIYPAGS